MREFFSKSFAQTFKIAERFSKVLVEGDLVRVSGGLGVGKTTFIKGIAQGFNFPKEEVLSSSFIILRRYEAKLPIFHIDLYRLKESQIPDEVYEIIFGGEGLVLIEWPERIKIRRDCFDIQIEFLSLSERRVLIKANSPRLEKRLKFLE